MPISASGSFIPSLERIIREVCSPEMTVDITPSAGLVQCPLKNRFLIGVCGANRLGPVWSGESAHPIVAS